MALKAILSGALSIFLCSHSISAAAFHPSDDKDGSSAVQTYPIPPGMPTIDSYTIEVQPPGGQVETVDSYLTTLSEINTTDGSRTLHNASVAIFDFNGPVDISITYNQGDIENAVVRPLSYGIEPKLEGGNKLKFSLSEPRDIMVQVNDDIWDVLNLLTRPIETDVPDPDDPDVLYFGPGINNGPANANVTDGILSVPSDKTVYIAGGGVLTAQILFNQTSNGAVKGRGIIQSGENLVAVEINNSINTSVEDITTFDSGILSGSSDGVLISGIRSFSWKGWGDGMDLYCTNNALVENAFMRNSDDCIALYQHRNEFYGDSSNITIQDSALWADYAHPINIGTHGNTDSPETMDGVTIRNIDVLDHHEPQIWYHGTIAINAGDSNLIQNVHIEDIRVEDFRRGQLINLRVMNGTKYNTSPGRGIKNVYIKDMVYNGDNAERSQILGYDADRAIENVTFVNLKVNGKSIFDDMEKPSWYFTADYIPMFVNEHVRNLTFKAV